MTLPEELSKEVKTLEDEISTEAKAEKATFVTFVKANKAQAITGAIAVALFTVIMLKLLRVV